MWTLQFACVLEIIQVIEGSGREQCVERQTPALAAGRRTHAVFAPKPLGQMLRVSAVPTCLAPDERRGRE